MPTKGTLILTPFPFTDLSGHKVRPALVLFNNKNGEDCIVAFVSSATEKKLGLYDVLITPSDSNGIKTLSTIKVNKIATLQKKVVLGELGMLESALSKEVDSRLKKLFNL